MAQEPSIDDDEFYYLLTIFDKSEDQTDSVNLFTDQTCGVLVADDAKSAEELQLQEAIFASVIITNTSINPEDDGGGELSMTGDSTKEIGESSHNICEICVEEKEIDEMVRLHNCSHLFCLDCVTKHVTAKVEEKNIKQVFITCPGLDCSGSIELDGCKQLIPKDVFDQWNESLAESTIDASLRFYCPYVDCSALLVNDSPEGGVIIREAECPECRRLFCVQCHVPWHSDVRCEELQQRLNVDERGKDDELMMRELAREKSWMRCPSCTFYVEKSEGCLHMTCRCGSQFCYACGEMWSETHGGCQPQLEFDISDD